MAVEKPRTVTLILSDTHVGGTTAISPPAFAIHSSRPAETQTAYANLAQRWLYDCWTELSGYVRSLLGGRGKHRRHRLIVAHLGDVVDGTHNQSPQVMIEPADQIRAAVDLLAPIFDLAQASFVCYGTDAHNGGAGAYEIEFAAAVGASHGWEFCLDIDGVVIDLAHHGRAGTREWTSSAASVAAEIAADYVARGLRPPDYVFRGHRHVIDDSGLKHPTTRALICPSWQLRTAYGHRVAGGKRRSDIGAYILDGSRLDDSRARYQGAPGSREVITL